MDRDVPGNGRFLTTRWSVVLDAGSERPPVARAALEQLCQTYWYPLYAYARRRGEGHPEASDLVQGFFARLLEKQDFGKIDPERGRFRSFLLTAMQHYMSNERARSEARKRGGGERVLSLELGEADSRYQIDPGHDRDAEQVFERNWAVALLGRTLETLEQDYQRRGKAKLFEALKPTLTSAGAEQGFASLAEECGMSEGALRVAGFRLRRSYRECLLAEIASTLGPDQDPKEELGALFAAMERSAPGSG